MAAIKARKAALSLMRRSGLGSGQVRSAGRLCSRLFADASHVHGLTKTVRPLLEQVALVCKLRQEHPAGQSAPAMTLPAELTTGLSPLLRRLLRRYGELACVPLSSPRSAARYSDSQDQVALRLRALAELAWALQSLDGKSLYAGVDDDGQKLHILLGKPLAPRQRQLLLAAAKTWNAVMPRPITGLGPIRPTRPGAPSPGELPSLRAANVVFRRQLERFLSRLYGLGCPRDAEYVHEMRVATRRLRSAMRVFRKVVSPELLEQKELVGELADILGSIRDQDIFLEYLQERAEAMEGAHGRAVAHLVRRLSGQRGLQYRRMVTLLRDAKTRNRLAGLQAAIVASGHSGGGKNAVRPVRQHAQKQLHRRLDDALDFGRCVRDLDDEKQHQLRIACKQLRYACDFFAGLYQGQLQEIVKPISRLQDLLGAAHDAVVFTARLEDIRRGLPSRGDRQAMELVQRDLHRRKKSAQAKAAGLWMDFTAPANIRRLRRLIDQGR